MSRTKYDEWEDLVRKISRSVARDFPEVEEDDLFQDLMLWVLESKGLVDPDAQYMTDGLFTKAKYFAWEYRKQALYITSQYAYRTTDVKRILETAFKPGDWSHSFVPDDARSLFDDDRLVVNSDVKLAYDYLSTRCKKHIYLRYALNVIPETRTEKDRLSYAIERLTDILNFYKPKGDHKGPGARKVISNTYANHLIQDD